MAGQIAEQERRHLDTILSKLHDGVRETEGRIATAIGTGRKEDMSIGIIRKTQRAARRLHGRLTFPESLVSLLTPQSMCFRKGIAVTSAHMAKGLEFD